MFNTNIEILLVMSSQLRITQNGAVIVWQKKIKNEHKKLVRIHFFKSSTLEV